MSTTNSPIQDPTPDRIMQLGSAFWASKTLLSAVELGVFGALAAGPMSAEQLRRRLGVHPRGARDFLDALVALGLLARDDQTEPIYRNTAEAELFLVPNHPGYVGGWLNMVNTRLYRFWGSLTEALQTGQPQNEIKDNQDLFATLYADPQRLAGFLSAMSSVSAGAATAIAEQFPWQHHRTFCDLGAAQGMVPVRLALRHAHLRGIGFDLAPVGPIFEKFVAGHGLADRVSFVAGDFFTDPLPPAEVYVMGHILHDWGQDQKRALLRRVYDALPDGGALVVYDAVIDDERRSNTSGLLMSLNMLLETHDGADYTGADCRTWMSETGFRSSYVQHLAGPDSMVVGRK